ncbi:MAG: NAD-dependent epimerase/dehydratase family protein [Sphingobacteriales bacterium]|nr:MAG: NAD-dependent epimerase/dehydratase family protein [Sphingobacteriales bacterium]
MKIVVTGSLGHISKPLTQELLRDGHEVTVISSRQERQKEIEALEAKAAIGSMTNADFLTETFKGADAVYLMEAMAHNAFFDHELDLNATMNKIAYAYKQAVEQAGVKRVVHLSSIGAHTDTGNGMLVFHYNVEQILKLLPADVAITTLRPVGFYYNIFGFIPTIKAQGAIVQNYGGDEREPWVSTNDIAHVAAEELQQHFEGRKVRYIASDEVSPNGLAKILGDAIGVPELKWVAISDEEFENRLKAVGMSPQIAKGYTAMNAGRRDGLYIDYLQNRPVLSPTKLTDFAKDFAAAYNQK